MNESLAFIRHIVGGPSPAFDILEIRLVGMHWGIQHMSTEKEAEMIIYTPTPELLAALHEATASACRDGKCACYMAGEEAEKETP